MYKNKNQKVNIAIIITIISVVVVLLVVLGVIIFQKTSDNDNTNNTTVATTIATTTPTTTITPTTTTLPTTTTPPGTKTGNENFEITQWGVTGYYNSSYSVNYQITAEGAYYKVSFSSDDFSGSCAGETLLFYERLSSSDDLTHIGNIAITPINVEEWYNSNPNEHSGDDSFIRKIGSYYYTYTQSKLDACDDGYDSSIQTGIMEGMRNHFNTLVAV